MTYALSMVRLLHPVSSVACRRHARVPGQPQRVAAVMAIDVTLGYFYKLLVQQLPACLHNHIRCFVMDDRGYLIAHQGLIEPNGKGPLEQQHITHKVRSALFRQIPTALLCQITTALVCQITTALFYRITTALFCQITTALICHITTALFCRITTALFCQITTALFCQITNALFCQITNTLFCQITNALICQIMNALFCQMSDHSDLVLQQVVVCF